MLPVGASWRWPGIRAQLPDEPEVVADIPEVLGGKGGRLQVRVGIEDGKGVDFVVQRSSSHISTLATFV